MKRAAFLAAVITTLLTTAAYAATWEIVPGLKNEHFIHYVDTESISGTPPGPVEAWKMVKNNLSDPTTRSGYCDYPSKDPNSKCIEKFITRWRFFSNKASCLLRQENHYSDKTIKIFEHECKPEVVVPGSMGELTWNFVYQPRSASER